MLEKCSSLLPEDRRAHGRLAWKSKDQKRQEAADRRSERAIRTPQVQIATLDWRLGVGQGAVKERARLAGKK